MKLIDCHCHFDQLTSEEQQTACQHFIVIGVANSLESCQQLLSLKKQYPSLKICLGIHPEYPQYYKDYLAVEKLIRQQRHLIVGIGEIGLPYFNLKSLSTAQKQLTIAKSLVIFEQFVSLASELDLAVNLHCVGDMTIEAISLLQRYQIKKALFHWFEGDPMIVKKIIENQWLISVSPDVITNQVYQHFVKTLPLTHICLESDGPWHYQDQRGTPAMIKLTAAFLAKLSDQPLDKILHVTQSNSRWLWELD